MLMRAAVIQRVKSASVTVDGQLISTISKGLLVFAAVGKDDTQKEAESMASKILKVKLWEDGEGMAALQICLCRAGIRL